MNIKELNKSKVPIVIIDNTLEKYNNLPIFQEKLNQANAILKNVVIPEFKNRIKK